MCGRRENVTDGQARARAKRGQIEEDPLSLHLAVPKRNDIDERAAEAFAGRRNAEPGSLHRPVHGSPGNEDGLAKGLAKGEIDEARKILLLQGRSRFGEPSPEVVAAVNAVTEVQKLEELTVRLLQAASWQELLGLNGQDRPGRSRKKKS